MLQTGTVYILVVTTLGLPWYVPASSYKFDYDSYSEENSTESVCSNEPTVGRGRAYIKGWAYYKFLHKCYPFYFGDANFDTKDNKFASELACNKKCRRNVPHKCYLKSPTTVKGGHTMVTYRPETANCADVKISADVKPDGKHNIFRHIKSCKTECRDEDFRVCLDSNSADCVCWKGDNRCYEYNTYTQTCEIITDGFCGVFRSSEDCYKRCGVLVKRKCKLPIQNISTCAKPTTRYGYNNARGQCEEFLGCADGGNSYASAKECWRTCAG
ncbi:unnamed protein product, partial [Ixodes hexagonus]